MEGLADMMDCREEKEIVGDGVIRGGSISRRRSLRRQQPLHESTAPSSEGST